ncbi:MAG: NACHT domain-containing protein, partial [Chloroflexi bacterium]
MDSQYHEPYLQRSKAKTPKSVRAAQKLFSALKQSRDQDGRSFKLDTLPAMIPLTVCDYEDPPDSEGRSIIDMYREHPNLLILGKPGSGKTTLLQQLTLELMDKELRERENDEKARWLPIFLSLYDWAKKRKPFKEWLTQQLLDSLSIHRLDKSLIHYWVSRGNFILLLDGLDEMNEEDSEKCIDGINTFSKETDSPFVISCQLDRYENLERNGHILNVGQKTVVVQNPKPSQAQNYLNQAGAERLSRFYQEKQSQHPKEFAARPLI